MVRRVTAFDTTLSATIILFFNASILFCVISPNILVVEAPSTVPTTAFAVKASTSPLYPAFLNGASRVSTVPRSL